MKHRCPRRPVEPLESRIAPSVFFLSGNSLAVSKGDGSSANDSAAATAVDASVAVLLHKGDSLVLDTNGNHAFDAGEIVYAKVTGGAAYFFAKDLNTSTSFGADEITGLAVGNGFKATINGDVNGSIATLLDSDNVLSTTVLQNTSLAGLTVSGRIIGDIRVGKNISNVKIGAAAEGDALGVQNVLTGTAADDSSFSLNGGSTTIMPAFSFAPGEAGGNITNVTIHKGAASVHAGDGSDSATGNGGHGGNISKLTFLDALGEFSILGGSGGQSTSATGTGGAGGGLSGLNLEFTSDSAKPIDTKAGEASGGGGGNGNSGGHGGDVRNVAAKFNVDALHWFYISGGGGGIGDQGDQTGNGGDGGAVINAKVTSTGKNDFVGFYGGDGKSAGSNGDGRGGNGGRVLHATYQALGGQYGPYAYGGNGGAGRGTGAGGAGGAATNVNFSIGDTQFGTYCAGGDGGDSQSGPGGNGGAVTASHIKAGSTTAGSLYLYSGGGGDGGTRGGNSGNVTASTIEATGKITGDVEVNAHQGGSGDTGGNGGAIKAVSVTINGVTGATLVGSGDGGTGNSGDGGSSGNVSNTRITNVSGDAGTLTIYTTNAGRSLGGNGRGGNAGSISKAHIVVEGGSTGTLGFNTGAGGRGNGTGFGGNGGNINSSELRAEGTASGMQVFTGSGENGASGGKSGSLGKISLKAMDALGVPATVDVGPGGSGSGEGGRGGATGSIKGVALDLPDTVVLVNAGPNPSGGAGGTGATSAGGAGGAVSGFKGHVGTLVLIAPSGGSAEGTGGVGGSVSGIKLREVDQFVRLIRGGDGGDGSNPGRGGNISGVSVPGDIGDFTSTFGITPGNAGMGGLIAGRSGAAAGIVDITHNGSISGITAERIAAILAGVPAANTLTRNNAVSKVSGLRGVTKVGADLGTSPLGSTTEAGGFTFVDNAGPPNPANGIFLLGDGDTALDGLVIILTGQFHSPVEPLKLIEVT
jgi:hypothetical protein